MEKKTRREIAEENFLEGYNCAQAVVKAYSDLFTVDENELLKIASAFGGGISRLREVCGAVSGMVMVYSMLKGYDGPEKGDVKKDHYAKVQELVKPMEEKNGSIVCRELLSLTVKHDVPLADPRTKEFYEKRPCKALVGDAAETLEKFLIKEGILKEY